jgi:hypothetical protein
MSGIFISYRRGHTSHIAGRLHDRLSVHFGEGQIFRDVDALRPGVDFVERIEEAVGSCDALIAVIGDDWLEVKDPHGHRRLDDTQDFVRLEIAAALSRKVLVVPVLVENARMPSESDLPEPLKKLARRNALELTDANWNYEVSKLIDSLKEVTTLSSPGAPASTHPRETVEETAAVETPSEEWRSELVEKTETKRSLRLRSGSATHVVEFRHGRLRKDVVLVDGVTAWAGIVFGGSRRSIEFELVTKSSRWPAQIVVRSSTVTDRIVHFQLAIAGRLVYEDGV